MPETSASTISGVKFVRLSPEFVNDRWGQLYEMVASALNVRDAAGMNNVLASFLCRATELWVGVVGDRITLTVVTSVGVSGPALERGMFILSMWAEERVSQEMWQEGFKALVEYCQKKDLGFIMTLTTAPTVIEMAKRTGAALSTNIMWRVEK